MDYPGIKASLQLMCASHNGGWQAMADALGTSKASLENRIYQRKGQRMPVDMAMQMQDISRTTYFAEAVALASGGMFVPMPAVEVLNEDIQLKYIELLDEVGAHAREYRAAIADGEVCKQERRRLERLGENICRRVTEINQLTFRIFSKSGDLNGDQVRSLRFDSQHQNQPNDQHDPAGRVFRLQQCAVRPYLSGCARTHRNPVATGHAKSGRTPAGS
nr:YmfL family putative regulatory protein [Laribacter hongkongensis]